MNQTRLVTARKPVIREHLLHHIGTRCVVSLLWVALLAGNLKAAETAVIPYKTLAGLYDGFGALKEKDRLLIIVKVVPAKSAPPPASPITLEIHSSKARLPVKLSPAGELTDFPLTSELRAEAPPVVSNQPEGTLGLSVAIQIKYSGKLTESAAWYEDGLKQINAAIKSQAGLMSWVVPKVKAIVFKFKPGQAVTVTLRGAKGDKSFPADEKGNVRIELLNNPAFKDAQIIFPVEPDSIGTK